MTTEAMFAQFPTLETKRFVLRQLREKDAEAIFRCFSDSEVMKYYNSNPYTERKQAEEMLEKFALGYEEKRTIRWGITRKGEDDVIGTIGFHALMPMMGRTDVGYELERAAWGQGVASEVLREVVRYAFTEMELNRVQGLVHPDNAASLRLLEKLGFQREGLLREYLKFQDGYADVVMLGLLKSEFE